ncbi:hypothetical protein L208DRAFT_1416625 [Tricholoma matsutake]|nr:hypothetical protein L208DRAFT_1416625 [Tricholoma matsutake 945]
MKANNVKSRDVETATLKQGTIYSHACVRTKYVAPVAPVVARKRGVTTAELEIADQDSGMHHNTGGLRSDHVYFDASKIPVIVIPELTGGSQGNGGQATELMKNDRRDYRGLSPIMRLASHAYLMIGVGLRTFGLFTFRRNDATLLFHALRLVITFVGRVFLRSSCAVRS